MEDAAIKIGYEFWLQWGAVGILIFMEGLFLWIVWREYRLQLPRMIETLVENGEILSALATLIRDRDRSWDRIPEQRRWQPPNKDMG